MFTAIALLFMLLNGIPMDKPSQTGKMPRLFPTLEACQEWQTSDGGQYAQQMAKQHPLVVEGKAMVKFECVPAEDDSI